MIPLVLLHAGVSPSCNIVPIFHDCLFLPLICHLRIVPSNYTRAWKDNCVDYWKLQSHVPGKSSDLPEAPFNQDS